LGVAFVAVQNSSAAWWLAELFVDRYVEKGGRMNSILKTTVMAAAAVVAAVSMAACTPTADGATDLAGKPITASTPADKASAKKASTQKAPTKKAPKKPALTVAQKNAVGSAKDYLSNQHFSRSGLVGQLKFEGYTTKEATFAVDAIHADWKAQAAGSAEDYLSNQHFSRSGLIGQLKFEGFTTAQATYGVSKAGL
jgi:hypothetical protein